MYQSSFFNSRDGDRVYKAEDWAEYFASFIGNGVFPNPSTGLQVQEGVDMRVVARSGRAWINGYFLVNRDDFVFTLDTADGVLSRIDRIVVRWSALDREITLDVKKGSLSVTPVAPDLQRDEDIYELALADIAVGAGVIAITQADITDLRLNSELCGIVVGTVEVIDTTTLFEQMLQWFADFKEAETAEFLEWFDTIRDILDEETAAHLLSMIQNLETQVSLLNQTKQDKIFIQQETPPVVEGAVWIKY